MEIIKNKRTSEEESVFARLKIDLYIALGGAIIPSLRCAAINWEPGQKEAVIYYFHDGLVDLPIQEHYSCVDAEANTGVWPRFKGTEISMYYDFKKVLSCPFPMLLPKVSEVVYLRKEPGREFNEINNYIPNWALGSVIRLKVNEALRGKVTGDLREIHLTWDETNTKALITFFHNGDITSEEQRHYEEIFKIATSTVAQWQYKGQQVIPKLAVRGVLYPKKIESPEDVDILYSRQEPFADPLD